MPLLLLFFSKFALHVLVLKHNLLDRQWSIYSPLQPGALSLNPGSLYAIDGDSGINEEITYSILSGKQPRCVQWMWTRASLELVGKSGVGKISNNWQVKNNSVCLCFRRRWQTVWNWCKHREHQHDEASWCNGAHHSDSAGKEETFKCFGSFIWWHISVKSCPELYTLGLMML